MFSEGEGRCVGGANLGALRHPETAREAWLNAFCPSVCFRLWNPVGLGPLGLSAAAGLPEFITRAAALGKIRHVRRAVLCWLA
jgi:hypothetical protein